MDEMITECSDQVNSEPKSPIIVGGGDGALGDDEREISPRVEAKNGTVRDGQLGVDRQVSGESTSGENNNGRKGKKGRRKKGGKNHHWKPYNKLCWEERQKIDALETKRACAKRQKRFESGHPVAPYNTTQFLMDDHDANEHVEPDLQDHDHDENQRHSGSYDSSGDEYYESPNDDDSFLVQDFSETYNNIHAERLENMSKQELVKEYINMESRLETLEKQVKVMEENKTNRSHLIERNEENVENVDCDVSEDMVTSKRELEKEIENLRSENARLIQENEILQQKYQ